MSIKLLPGGARLTVLGSGYSNASFESGDGLTEDGKLWEDIAGDLGYDFGDDVDWDQIAGGEIDWSEDVIYVGNDGTIYSDIDGTGEWKSEDGKEYDGDGTMAVEKNALESISDGLMAVVEQDNELIRYAIDEATLKSLYGGPVSEEKTVIVDHPERPHKFSPPVYYIQDSYNTAYLFSGEPFSHTTQDGGNMTVYDEGVTIRNPDDIYGDLSNIRYVYWSSCTTLFTDKYLPADIGWMPIQYICWQCLYGSFNRVLITERPDTITTSMIQAGESQYETFTENGKTYYKLIR